ncbi:MAG TPA: nuclear transport factor 2 family protein [Candidatus Acidoferrales bacterium]|nr:nuclear transport factor 2 family protein [Candidatus Acidoferrales bacterium]
MTRVRRRDGKAAEFDPANVSAGVAKAGASVREAVKVAKEVSLKVSRRREISAEELSGMVATELRKVNRAAAEEFVRYRNDKARARRNVTPKDAAQKFVDGFNRHDGSIMSLFTEDVTWQDPGSLEPEGGWERMKKGLLSLYSRFPDIHAETSHFMVDGEWVCLEAVASGTFKGGKWFVGGKERTLPTVNRTFKVSAAMFFRATPDGHLSYWSLYWDNASFDKQIGLKPEQIE